MKKYAKKLLALAMVLAMVLSLGVSAYAEDDIDYGYYTQDPLEDAPAIIGTATVYLSIVSDRVYDSNGNYIQIERYNLPVSLTGVGDNGTVFYVSDVLLAARSQYNWLQYYTASGYTVGQHLYSVYGVMDSAVSTTQIFQPVEYDFYDVFDYYDDPDDAMCAYLQYIQNGWKFRINNMIPLLDDEDAPASYTGDYPGALIDQAYVQNGDNIFLYYADIYEGDNYNELVGGLDYESVTPTEFLKLNDLNYSAGAITTTISTSSVFTDIDYNTWEMDWDFSNINFTSFTDTIDVCIDNQYTIYNCQADSLNTYTIPVSGLGLTSGTHTISVVPSSELLHTVCEVTYGFNSYVGYGLFTI